MFNIFKRKTNSSDLNQNDWVENQKVEKNAIILDVRTPQECSGGVIPKAKNINFFSPNFKSSVSKLDKNKTYFVYCRSGNRSSKACSIMQELGFEKTYNLVGGIMNWKGQVARPSK